MTIHNETEDLKTNYHIAVINEKEVSYDDHDSDDPYSAPNSHTEHDILGIKPVGKKDYFDLIVPYKIVPGKEYYLLYAVYTMGDSFSTQYGSGIEYYGLYTKDQLDVAKENQTYLKSFQKDYTSDMDIPDDIYLKDPNGGAIKCFCPWGGYFESLDSVNLKKVTVTLR